MKIRVHVTGQGISFFVVGSMGDEVFLTSLSMGNLYVSQQRKALIRELFKEGDEYDSTSFLKVWTTLKRWKMPRFPNESVRQIADSLRGQLGISASSRTDRSDVRGVE
jgi:hypothetical protein